ncbi:hypothetical protein C5748_16995 [Phyllobacterium phragmitis]|uniref:Uncharacterized protein n=1 Tax=Phyllobacterium phragmitis TaxID=2670329 RepID=A0A2S9INQ6_9HYPH|nr:hypothetical protein [Phyllobacterium phragmitis]PRD42163.1 hypothetical protein C5748_16995 [Phyllobacterium phragmitis]
MKPRETASASHAENVTFINVGTSASRYHFFNPFSGECEGFDTPEHAYAAMFKAAADRIQALSDEVARLKADILASATSG